MTFPKTTYHAGMASPQVLLHEAERALRTRRDQIKGSPHQKTGANRTCYQRLLDSSPSKLAPVLVRRKDGEWFAALLFDKLDRSWRLLLFQGDWHLIRVRSSAEVVQLPVAMRDKIISIMKLQQHQHARIMEILPAHRKRARR